MNEDLKLRIEQFSAHVTDMARYMKQKLGESNPTETLKMEIFERRGGGKPERYVIRIAEKEFETDDKSVFEVKRFSNALSKVADKLNDTRGYRVCKVWEDFWYEGRDVFGRTTELTKIVKGIILYTKPCKEFELLRRMLRRYANHELGELELFSVAIVGKRGTNYTESGKREYYAYNPRKCLDILEWIRKNRRLSDTLDASVEECVDCEDRDYSRQYETESYGTKHQYLSLKLFQKDGSRRAAIDTMFI